MRHTHHATVVRVRNRVAKIGVYVDTDSQPDPHTNNHWWQNYGRNVENTRSAPALVSAALDKSPEKSKVLWASCGTPYSH